MQKEKREKKEAIVHICPLLLIWSPPLICLDRTHTKNPPFSNNPTLSTSI